MVSIREVAETGEIDEDVAKANAVLAELEAGRLPGIAARHGLTWRLPGTETAVDCRRNAPASNC